MPLPKAPTKPATLLDLTTAVLARATRPKGRAAPTGPDAPESPADAAAAPPPAGPPRGTGRVVRPGGGPLTAW